MRIIPMLLACLMTGCSGKPLTPAEQIKRTRDHADELHAHAMRLAANPTRAPISARLHRESARLRPPSDPRAFDCYAEAAQVLISAHQVHDARLVMEEAAAFALSRGDSLNAARSYAEAVRIAAQEGLPRRVIVLAALMRAVSGGAAIPDAELRRLNEGVAALTEQAQASVRAQLPAPAR